MATGFVLDPEFYVPCGFVIAAALAPPRPILPKVGRAAIALAALAMAGGAITRLAVMFWSLQNQTLSPWDAGLQAIAGAWLNGQPIYPNVNEGFFYSWVYGPLLYEIIGSVQSVVGIGNSWAGLPMVLAELAAVGITWLTARRMGISRKASAAAAGVMIVELGVLRLGGVRADQIILLLASLALATVPSLAKSSRSAFWLGLCGGLAMALKFTGFAYMLPALLPVLLRPGADWRRILAWTSAGCGLGCITPYLVPGAGLGASTFVGLIGGYRPTPAAFSHNLFFSVAVIVPPLLWSRRESRGQMLKSLAHILIPLAPVFVIACNAGAGPWHLASFLPALSLLLAQALSAAPAIDLRRLVLLCGIFILAGIEVRQQLPQLLNSAPEITQRRVRAEIAGFLKDHPSEVVSLGSTWGGPRSSVDLGAFQAELPRAGYPLLFMEQSFEYVNSAANTDIFIRQRLSGCRVRFWINASGQPFAAPYYDPLIRQKFLERYELAESTKDLAIWRCRTDSRG